METGYANGNDWNKSEIAYGSGCIFNFNGIQMYLPIITENGLFNGGEYHEVIRIQLQTTINFSRFF